MSSLAPILLFVYNRPKHTKIVLDSLAENIESKSSVLIIYSDGLKSNSSQIEQSSKEELSLLLNKEDRFKEVIIKESSKNKGLAKSIIDGVTECVNFYGKVIVLEDDVVVSPYFLLYMNSALNAYKNSKKVMHVSAYSLPFNTNTKQGTYFFKPCTCWGWGTWKDAWTNFEKNPQKQINILEENNHWKEFTIENSLPTHKHQLYQNFNDEINTWAVFWYISVFLKGGTSLHPIISMTRNIGFDGTGENCGEWGNDNPYLTQVYDKPFIVRRKYIISSRNMLKKLIAYVEYAINNKRPENYTIRDKFYLFRTNIFK